MKYIAAIATIALSAALTAQDSKPTTHLLRYQHEKGQVGAFQITNDIEMTFVIDAERKMKMSTLTTTYATYKILEASDGLASFELGFYRIKSSMSNQSGSLFKFDTDEEGYDPGPMKPMLALLEGKVNFKLNARGTVSEVKIPERLRPILAQVFGGKEPTQMFRQFLIELPEAALAVGGSWDTKLKQTMNKVGKLDITAHNKLAAQKGTASTVEQVFDFKLQESKGIGGFEMKTATGTIVLDPKLALPAKVDTSMHLIITSGKDQAGNTIHMRMKASMRPTAMPAVKPAVKPSKQQQADK